MSHENEIYQIVPQGRVAIVRFHRDVFDSEKILAMQEALRLWVAGAAEPWVVLDMTHVKHIGSSFLGTLMDVSLKITHKGGKACLCGMSPQVADLLALTRLDQIIPAFPTADEAYRSLQA